MKTYIVKYAPISGFGYSIQDLKTAKILSDLTEEEVKLEFENRCNKASADIKNYQGVFVKVYSLDEFIESLPTDIF